MLGICIIFLLKTTFFRSHDLIFTCTFRNNNLFTPCQFIIVLSFIHVLLNFTITNYYFYFSIFDNLFRILYAIEFRKSTRDIVILVFLLLCLLPFFFIANKLPYASFLFFLSFPLMFHKPRK